MIKNKAELESRWANLCSEESMRCSTAYWNCRAEDYADFIVNSDFDHGRKILRLFEKEGMVNPDWNVLDIGSGPGAISIPFSEEVHAVTSVEPASEMAKKLLEQASIRNRSNITLVPLTWQDVPISEYIQKYDLVICSHSIWHFPDIFNQIDRMQQVSRKFCALSHGIYQNGQADPISQKLGIPRDDADRFIMVKRIFENRGIFPQVSVVPTSMKRSVESARSMMVLGLKKYREPAPEDLTLIDEYIKTHSKGGMYKQEGKMGVLWWRIS
jgi:SAM-dependent methyltransferase